MARVVSVRVSESLLSGLFDAFRIWEKLESGVLAEVLGPDAADAARADWCSGSISYYTRIRNARGFEVGRLHYLFCPRGVQRFPSYVIVGDARLYRRGHDEQAP